MNRDARLVSALYRTYRKVGLPRPDSPVTFADRFEAQVEEGPERVALVQDERSLRYHQVDAAANRFAHWAQSIGVVRGDVVALLIGNRPELAVAQIGLAKLGAVAALINHNLRAHALAHCVAVAEPVCAVLHSEFEEEWQSALPHFEKVPPVYALGGRVAGAEPLDETLAHASPVALDPGLRAGLTAGDPYLYIYTSGTTGLPKAARISHVRGLQLAGGAIASLSLAPGDRMYIPLPLYHSAGGGMALGGSLLSGAAAVIAPKFSASHFWSDCVRHGATTFQYIGELCRYLLNTPEHPDERRHTVRGCVGNGLRPEVWRPFQERFRIPQIVEFYGATEGNVAIINYEGKVGSVGRLPALLRRAMGTHLIRYDVEADAHVRGRDGFCIPCRPGEVGEAIGRINSVTRFEGYTSESATEKKILRDVFEKGDAYFRTGDLLRMDAEGYFYFVDRIGDTFRWKGENVATSEVAEVLSLAPGVREANVYGVSVPGQEGRAGMAALVVDEKFDPAALYARVANELPSYARPVFVRIGSEMEVTGTLKHRKVELVKQGFDPAVVPDPVLFAEAQAQSYVPLAPALYERILAGEVRL
ncbi:MAG TPA: long-chain-acyl-CoA synthetase [Myxococcota bacterium]|nr:long-chain-acyl-CoA synthetase [Myxococcota bacterium]